MAGSVRRIAVQPCDDVGGDAVDLAVPAGVELAVLVPTIADLVAGCGGDTATAWYLRRLDEPALDTSKTLAENGIRDGEVLLLATEAAAPPAVPGPRPATGNDVEPSNWPRRVRMTVALWAVGIGAFPAVWAGLLIPTAARSIPVAALALAAGGAAVLTGRRDDDVLASALAVTAVMLVAAAGLLAVPAGPAPPNVLLAAAAGGAAAVLLLRWTQRGTVVLTAAATFAAILAVAVLPGAVGPVSTLTVGVVAAIAAIGVLGVAPRLSLLLAGVTPNLSPDSAMSPDSDGAPDSVTDEDRLVRGNALLTGVLSGAAAAATVGAVLVALGPGAGPWGSGAVFVVALAAALALRARSHADPRRRSVLLGCGLACATAAVVMVTLAVPTHVVIPALCTAAAGIAVLTTDRVGSASPLVRRGVDLLEYLMLAALLPLACWITGLYGLVRGLSLG